MREYLRYKIKTVQRGSDERVFMVEDKDSSKRFE